MVSDRVSVSDCVTRRFLEVIVEDGDLSSAIALLRKKTYSLRRELKWRAEDGPKPSRRRRMKKVRAGNTRRRHAFQEQRRQEEERMWSAIRDASAR